MASTIQWPIAWPTAKFWAVRWLSWGSFQRACHLTVQKKLSLDWHFICVVIRQSHPEDTLEDINRGPVMLFYMGVARWGKAPRSSIAG